MYVVWVTLDVVPERREEFLNAIAENARVSVQDEEGCLRFDVVELGNEPNRFAFYEIYRDEDAFNSGHLQSAHYLAYRRIAQRAIVPGSQHLVTGSLMNTFTRIE